MSHTGSAQSRAGSRHRRPLKVAFFLVSAFMVIEVAAGLWTGSLALLADAGHMATDSLGLGMALAAIAVADRVKHHRHQTYGLYRLEVLAAFINALLLFGVAGYVLFEALERISDPPSVLSGPMLLVALGGLGVNLVAWRLLRAGAQESINVEGAFVEVLADLFGSVGAVSAALLIRFAGWSLADPLFGAAVGLFVIPRAWRLASRATRILLQAAPPHIDVEAVSLQLGSIEGVLDVHDIHVWTLTSEMEVASAHLITRDGGDPHRVLADARRVLDIEYGVAHATIQVESAPEAACVETSW